MTMSMTKKFTVQRKNFLVIVTSWSPIDAHNFSFAVCVFPHAIENFRYYMEEFTCWREAAAACQEQISLFQILVSFLFFLFSMIKFHIIFFANILSFVTFWLGSSATRTSVRCQKWSSLSRLLVWHFVFQREQQQSLSNEDTLSRLTVSDDVRSRARALLLCCLLSTSSRPQARRSHVV